MALGVRIKARDASTAFTVDYVRRTLWLRRSSNIIYRQCVRGSFDAMAYTDLERLSPSIITGKKIDEIEVVKLSFQPFTV